MSILRLCVGYLRPRSAGCLARQRHVFDAGPLGYPAIAAHGHADALSVCLAMDGEWWLVDPGTYAYHDEIEWREYFRGTSAHNTLLVDGASQSTSGGAFLWVKHANARIVGRGDEPRRQWIGGSHDGYPGVTHQRTVTFDAAARLFRILDAVEGSGTRALSLHFHFHPDVVVEPAAAANIWIARRPGSARTCRIEADPRWQWAVRRGDTAPILGWYSSALNRKEPCPVLCGVWRGALPMTAETTLALRP